MPEKHFLRVKTTPQNTPGSRALGTAEEDQSLNQLTRCPGESERSRKGIRNKQKAGKHIYYPRGCATSSWDYTKLDHSQKKLADSKNTVEALRKIFTSVSNDFTSKSEALKKLSNDYQKSQGRTSKLQKEARNLRRKILRAPGRRSREVEAAIARVANEFKQHLEGEYEDLLIWSIHRGYQHG